MKKVIIVILILFIASVNYGQQNKPVRILTNQDYLQKSKQQQTTAWVLLGAGAAATAGGLLWYGNETSLESVLPFIITCVGVASMAISIPFFIRSSFNKRKSVNTVAGLKFESTYLLQQRIAGIKNYPAVSLKIQLLSCR